MRATEARPTLLARYRPLDLAYGLQDGKTDERLEYHGLV
jgi:hypothetical protein